MTWTVDPLLQEYVNEKLFENTDRVVPETAELTKDELNALRYVQFKLKKKFTKSSHPYKDEFLLCLSQMNKDKGGDVDDDDTEAVCHGKGGKGIVITQSCHSDLI